MNILTKQTLDKGNTPKDILLIRNLIEGEGIEEYEKNTVNFISEYLNTYIADILSDSKQYASYAERHKLNIEDVKLAVKLKQDSIYTKKPEINSLRELAKEVNPAPLLNIPDTPQILLPAPEHSLLRNNFQVHSEEILQSLANQSNKQEQTYNKLEEEFGLTSKRHSMIGLKRRDYDERPSVVLSKKKMRLSCSEDATATANNININTNFGNFTNTIPNVNMNVKKSLDESHGNIIKSADSKHAGKHHQHPSNFNKHNEDMEDGNFFDHDDESLINQQNNFLHNDNSEMEDMNYYDAFS